MQRLKWAMVGMSPADKLNADLEAAKAQRQIYTDKDAARKRGSDLEKELRELEAKRVAMIQNVKLKIIGLSVQHLEDAREELKEAKQAGNEGFGPDFGDNDDGNGNAKNQALIQELEVKVKEAEEAFKNAKKRMADEIQRQWVEMKGQETEARIMEEMKESSDRFQELQEKTQGLPYREILDKKIGQLEELKTKMTNNAFGPLDAASKDLIETMNHANLAKIVNLRNLAIKNLEQGITWDELVDNKFIGRDWRNASLEECIAYIMGVSTQDVALKIENSAPQDPVLDFGITDYITGERVLVEKKENNSGLKMDREGEADSFDMYTHNLIKRYLAHQAYRERSVYNGRNRGVFKLAITQRGDGEYYKRAWKYLEDTVSPMLQLDGDVYEFEIGHTVDGDTDLECVFVAPKQGPLMGMKPIAVSCWVLVQRADLLEPGNLPSPMFTPTFGKNGAVTMAHMIHQFARNKAVLDYSTRVDTGRPKLKNENLALQIVETDTDNEYYGPIEVVRATESSVLDHIPTDNIEKDAFHHLDAESLKSGISVDVELSSAQNSVDMSVFAICNLPTELTGAFFRLDPNSNIGLMYADGFDELKKYWLDVPPVTLETLLFYESTDEAWKDSVVKCVDSWSKNFEVNQDAKPERIELKTGQNETLEEDDRTNHFKDVINLLKQTKKYHTRVCTFPVIVTGGTLVRGGFKPAETDREGNITIDEGPENEFGGAE